MKFDQRASEAGSTRKKVLSLAVLAAMGAPGQSFADGGRTESFEGRVED
jgi:hypothetical protein